MLPGVKWCPTLCFFIYVLKGLQKLGLTFFSSLTASQKLLWYCLLTGIIFSFWNYSYIIILLSFLPSIPSIYLPLALFQVHISFFVINCWYMHICLRIYVYILKHYHHSWGQISWFHSPYTSKATISLAFLRYCVYRF